LIPPGLGLVHGVVLVQEVKAVLIGLSHVKLFSDPCLQGDGGRGRGYSGIGDGGFAGVCGFFGFLKFILGILGILYVLNYRDDESRGWDKRSGFCDSACFEELIFQLAVEFEDLVQVESVFGVVFRVLRGFL